jgi:hypothetical protein
VFDTLTFRPHRFEFIDDPGDAVVEQPWKMKIAELLEEPFLLRTEFHVGFHSKGLKADQTEPLRPVGRLTGYPDNSSAANLHVVETVILRNPITIL